MENHFSEVVELFLHNLHKSGPGWCFMCCEQGNLCISELENVVFVPHYSSASMLFVECLCCGGFGETVAGFVRS